MLDDIKKTLWASADKLRANMDAAEYKHLVLGLIFVKYISDAFVARQAELTLRLRDPAFVIEVERRLAQRVGTGQQTGAQPEIDGIDAARRLPGPHAHTEGPRLRHWPRSTSISTHRSCGG